ncbi:hypothetical protein [Reichenbachiella versicolor]|uniref:hypothetical protein n=1 Tax=Reichenbachiella versicolor TaxID=1821036 RepID=UPI000D6DECC9|nr:hypothetical protein [Reichenbachiella versicolor]
MKILQRIGVFFLVIQLITGTLSAPFAYIDYEMRKDYIAEYLCVNKSKPMLNCNGKCFLAKKLKKASKEQQRDQKNNLKETFSFYNELLSEIVFVTIPIDNIIPNLNIYLKFVTKLFGHDIFHPPRV